MTHYAEVAMSLKRLSDKEVEQLAALAALQQEKTMLKLRRINEIVMEISENPGIQDSFLAEYFDVDERLIVLARTRIRQIQQAAEAVPSSRLAREHCLSTETVDMIRGISL